MALEEQPARRPEFWSEEDAEDRRELWRHAAGWVLSLALLLAGLVFALWWSASAVRFGSSRAEVTTPFEWKVSGAVRDAQSGAPVPWAKVEDDPAGHPPLASATADHRGVFELPTIAEPHDVIVSAMGYRAKRFRVGRPWYLWMPRGAEQVAIDLEPIPSPQH